MFPGSLRIILAIGVFSLTACASRSDLDQIQHKINSLSQDMQALSQQAIRLSEQNELNARSTQGVYLLPAANAPALVESQIGLLKISLIDVVPAMGGTQVTLLIQQSTLQQLPGFSAIIAWKSDGDNVSSASDNANGQHSFTVPVNPASPGEAKVTLILPDVTAETLSWVRIHQIAPISQPTDSPAR